MDEGEFAGDAFEVQVTAKVIYTFPTSFFGYQKSQSIWLNNFFQYANDLYFLAPFYHLAFPQLDSLIIVDIDLEFR